MSHTQKIIATKQVNNEQVAYLIQCCNDPHESTWHTISVLMPDHDSILAARKIEIESRHEAMVQWREKQAQGKV